MSLCYELLFTDICVYRLEHMINCRPDWGELGSRKLVKFPAQLLVKLPDEQVSKGTAISPV